MSVFYPHALEKTLKAEKSKTKFVHYTGAENGLKILRDAKLWMRKTSCMNDFMEVEHGLTCLRAAWAGGVGRRLQAYLDGRFTGLGNELASEFDKLALRLKYDTYIACFSEHGDPSGTINEDQLGRLSMWRAYGGSNSVAIVIDTKPFVTPVHNTGIYSSPVAYLDDQEFAAKLSTVIDNMENDPTYLASFDRKLLRDVLVNVFRFGVLCTKHLGFAEEREWRLFHTPGIDPEGILSREIETVHGVPQFVCKIPLADVVVEITPSAILDRVIIGPTQYPNSIAEAFRAVLQAREVPDHVSKVVISDIPLRT
jgi:hypothetical protein